MKSYAWGSELTVPVSAEEGTAESSQSTSVCLQTCKEEKAMRGHSEKTAIYKHQKLNISAALSVVDGRSLGQLD